MRQVALTTSKGGITRLRTKGAALQDSLYDLENGYITAARTIHMRPGTRRLYELPAGTFGLVGFNGVLHTFASSEVAGIPSGVTLHVLASPDGADRELVDIHFSEPFLGFLYVVAEFDRGSDDPDDTREPIFHYWLQEANEWEASTVYQAGDLVVPESPTPGIVFRASREGEALPLWQPNKAYEVGDTVEPSTYNGFYYEVTQANGDTPTSGDTEPDWPTEEGALVLETSDETEVDVSPTPTPTGTAPNVKTIVPEDTRTRYGGDRRLD